MMHQQNVTNCNTEINIFIFDVPLCCLHHSPWHTVMCYAV